MKLWQKEYQLNREIEKFTVGDDYIIDQKLIKYDCIASIAHAEMLERIGIISERELIELTNELNGIIKLNETGEFAISIEDEDCHTAIENHLTKKLGQTGKKIHTFRSRNDQVVTALRLLYKDELSQVKKLISFCCRTLFNINKEHGDISIPGFTHTRKAMPSTIGLWTQAFIDSMKDNHKILDVTYYMIDQSPLGTGAGYGIPFEIDREFTAKRMGFRTVQENPLYVQNSRGKFESHILHTLSLLLFDINKISSDLIFFTLPEFGFFELPDDFLTGSSIMPHKKNPDVLELLRSKYHLITSYEMQIKNITANLISGYHRDFQLTKEPVIKSFEITKQSLAVISLVFKNLKVNRKKCEQAMTEELYSVDRANELLRQGMSFRDAYKKISESINKKEKNPIS